MGFFFHIVFLISYHNFEMSLHVRKYVIAMDHKKWELRIRATVLLELPIRNNISWVLLEI